MPPGFGESNSGEDLGVQKVLEVALSPVAPRGRGQRGLKTWSVVCPSLTNAILEKAQ